MKVLVTQLLLTIVRVFFRDVEVTGLERVPEGPVLIVANHPNGLADPGILRLVLKREVGFLSKSTLFENVVSRLILESVGAVPVYRAVDGHDTSQNASLYELCRERFEAGRSIVIFPEGISHDEPKLQKLKTGAARIALRALADTAEELTLHILPVGLFYDDKTTFRSDVSAAVGEPIDPSEWVVRYVSDGHEVAVELTRHIRESLAEVVLEADTVAIYDALVSVAHWTSDASLGVDEAHERARGLAEAYRRMSQQAPEEAAAIAEDVVQFRTMLERVGVENAIEAKPPRLGVGLVARKVMPMILTAPLALIGVVSGWPFYRALGPIAHRLAKGELDIVSSVKAVLGAVVLPLVYLAEAVVIAAFFGWLYGLAAFVLLPACGLIAVRWGESLSVRKAVLKGHWLRSTRAEKIAEIEERRRELSVRIQGALERYGA